MENGSRRKHMAKPSFCQSQQHEKKETYMKKHRHQAAWFIFPPSSQFQEFYEWKMSGDRFSKAAMACVSWAYHAVLVSSCCLDLRASTSTLHHAVWLLTDNLIHTDRRQCQAWNFPKIKTRATRVAMVDALSLKRTTFVWPLIDGTRQRCLENT